MSVTESAFQPERPLATKKAPAAHLRNSVGKRGVPIDCVVHGLVATRRGLLARRRRPLPWTPLFVPSRGAVPCYRSTARASRYAENDPGEIGRGTPSPSGRF
jgi:hypothetical protein